MRDMIDSRVEWIGSIPASWQTLTIGSLFKVRNEKVNDTDYPPLSVTKGGIVPQMENVAKSDANDNRKKVLTNDFVINSRSDRKQSCGVSSLDGSVSLINTVLYPAKGAPIVPAYLNYLLKNYGFAEEFYRWGHGIVADLWTTRWQEMKSILLPMPSMEEQQQILDAISEQTDKVDALIENVQAQVEKLNAYKQSLVTEVVTKGLDPSVPMKDTGVDWIGAIPEKWDVIKLKYITHISRGLFNHRPRNDPQFYDGEYPFIQTGDVARAKKYITTYSQTLNDRGKSVSKQFPKGTMTMTIAANVGDVAILGFDAYFPDSVVGFTVKDGFDENYVYYLFQALRESFVRASIVSTQLNLNIERSKEIVVSVTYDMQEQKQIAAYLEGKCDQVDRLISIKQSKIEKLEQYKHSLIYEYVTGKKEVP